MSIRLVKKFYFHLGLVLLLLFLSSIQAINPNNSLIKNENEELSSISMEIVEHCFNKEQVIIINDEKNVSTSDQLFKSSMPVTSFNFEYSQIVNSTRRFRRVYRLNETYLKTKYFPATGVYIVLSRNDRLSSILRNLKNSIWWDHGASFLVVNKNPNNDCKYARMISRILWSYNILSSIYMCNKDSQLILYTYNPFSRKSPNLWNSIEDQNFPDEHWTLFDLVLTENVQHQLFKKKNQALCNNIYFDKSADLGGYNMKIALPEYVGGIYYDRTKRGYDRCGGIDVRVMCEVLKHINSTITVKFSSSLGFITDHGTPTGYFKDVLYGTVDFTLTASFLRDFLDKQQTYPHSYTGVNIVSLKTALTSLQRFIYFFDLNFWLFFATNYILLFLTVKYILNQSISSATLELLRIFVGSSTQKTPERNSSRIFFITLVFYCLFISFIIQGLLNAVSTSPISIPTIDSIGDLLESKLPIYGPESFKSMIIHKKLTQRYHVVDKPYDCVAKLSHSDQLVCLIPELVIEPHSSLIHFSKTKLFEKNRNFLVAEDFPLLNKFDDLLMRMNEAGSLVLFSESEKFRLNRNIIEESTEEDFKIEIIIGLVITVIGLSLSILALIVEILIKMISKNGRMLQNLRI